MDDATKAIFEGLMAGLANSGKFDTADWNDIVFHIEKAAFDTGGQDEVDAFLKRLRPQIL